MEFPSIVSHPGIHRLGQENEVSNVGDNGMLVIL